MVWNEESIEKTDWWIPKRIKFYALNLYVLKKNKIADGRGLAPIVIQKKKHETGHILSN